MDVILATVEPDRYVKRSFIDSEFIEIKSNDIFEVDMQYPLLHMKNAEKQCFVREEVYQRMLEAAKFLPTGYRFKIWDAWRPFALQDELYRVYSEEIIQEFELEHCSEEQKKVVINKFVSEPICDRNVPPVHTTGGAVDVTLLDRDGNELEMGTGFDEFSDKTYTSYFENEKNELIRKNRRLLYGVMTRAGFTNLPSEWWHYDYGDRFWGFYTNMPAMYKGIFTSEEIYGSR